MQTEDLEGQESIFDRDSACGKMSSVLSQVGGTLKRVKKSLGRIFKKSSKRSSKLKNHTFMLLDLRPGAGNMLGAYWEYDPPWLGSFGTRNYVQLNIICLMYSHLLKLMKNQKKSSSNLT